MISMHQGARAQAPTPPSRPINPDELSEKINEAVNQALSGNRRQDGQSIREVIEQVKAEVQAAREQGQSITIQPQFDPENIIPPQAVDISIAFFVMIGFIVVGLPLARAFARRMDRRSQPASASELTPKLDRIEQAIEAIAIEVERVSEGQRYTTKAIADLRGLPASNAGWPAEAQRVPVGEARRP